MISHRFAAAAAAVLLLTVTAAQAKDLRPIQAHHIALGEVSGSAYYTVEPDGFHIVATFAHDETDANPLRVRAVLAAGQSVVFSTPGHGGTRAMSVRIAREGESVVVADHTQTD